MDFQQPNPSNDQATPTVSDPAPLQTPNKESKKNKKAVILSVLLILSLLANIALGYFVYEQKNEQLLPVIADTEADDNKSSETNQPKEITTEAPDGFIQYDN